jgi:hypothetical protein
MVGMRKMPTMCKDDLRRSSKKEIRTADELERQILAELKATQFCESADRVVVLPWAGDPNIANWSVNNFGSGTSLAIDVEMALLDIVPPLQSRYDLGERGEGDALVQANRESTRQSLQMNNVPE